MELLIVIGVLGILAAGLLAAIDPFEQLKKAKDNNNRSATIELLQALQRYYANHGDFPWNMPAYSNNICGKGVSQNLEGFGYITTSAMSIQNPRFAECLITVLTEDGELKSTYIQGLGGVDIYVGSDPQDRSDVTVCFEPKSKSGMLDPSTKYLVNNSGGYTFTVNEQTGIAPANACVRQAGDCAQCFK